VATRAATVVGKSTEHLRIGVLARVRIGVRARHPEGLYEVGRLSFDEKIAGLIRRYFELLAIAALDRELDTFHAETILSRLRLLELRNLGVAGSVLHKRVHGSPEHQLGTIVVQVASHAVTAGVHSRVAALATNPSLFGNADARINILNRLIVAGEGDHGEHDRREKQVPARHAR